MLAALLQFSISAVLVVGAGIVLTRSADAISDRTGLGKVLVGSIFLAAATSLPELTTNISALRLGLPDLALGNLVGSSLFNLLILAIADLLHRSRGALLSRTAAAHALSGAATIGLTALVGIGLLLPGSKFSWSLFEISVASWLVLLGYLFSARLVYHDQRAAADEESLTVLSHDPSTQPWTLPVAVTSFVLAAGLIFFVAPILAESAGKIAELSGMGDTFVGTTLVAFFTSLPEFVATLAALRMGAMELAIGNIFGSNAFNMLLIVPLDAFHEGSLLHSVSPTHALTCFSIILVTCVVLLGQLYRVERRVLLIEPDAAMVILLILASLALVYFVG
jgi:cation:H+ antiporter